jgi:DeoR/GlpR family transcriptional regulator of sugar metabolism
MYAERKMHSPHSGEAGSMSKDQTITLAQRHQKLLQLVETKGQMSVDDLANHFDVSDDTIRRDLQTLERRRLLLRTHGGAVSTALLVHRATPFLTRANANADAKTRIGRSAAQLISDGETLIVNGGSTTFAFAANLGLRRNLTIVTNNVAMLPVLPTDAVQAVYLLGGQYNTNLGSTVGSVGFSSGTINVDTAVLGVSGLTSTDGLSTTFLEEASMFAQMIAAGRRTIVIADATKFGYNAFAQIGPLSTIDILVTDSSPPADLCEALVQANVQVIVASS